MTRVSAWTCGTPEDGADLQFLDGGWSLTVSVGGMSLTVLPTDDDLMRLCGFLVRRLAPSERRVRAIEELMS